MALSTALQRPNLDGLNLPKPLTDSVRQLYDFVYSLRSSPDAWKAFTPTLTGNANNVTTIRTDCAFQTIGKVVFLQVLAVFTVPANQANISFDLPVNGKTDSQLLASGAWSGGSFSNAILTLTVLNETTAFVWAPSNFTPGPSHWALAVSGTYEAA